MRALLALLVGLGPCVGLLLLCDSAHAAELPEAAPRYRHELTRVARQELGLAAPVSALAAQVHQESGWRSNARSAYAEGLTQFTPPTAAWISRLYPDLGEPAPLSPSWAMRAMVRYDRHLVERQQGRTECDRWWLGLRGYNGGPGHVTAEARLAADPLDRGSVDAQCGRAQRSAKHCAESIGYPHRILLTHQPRYLAAGWGGTPICLGGAP